LVALPRRGFLRSSLDSVGDLGWSDSTAEDRQDFDRGISFWSRKVWKAVGGLGEEGFSSMRDRFLSLLHPGIFAMIQLAAINLMTRRLTHETTTNWRDS
jgi:hypothetical protein